MAEMSGYALLEITVTAPDKAVPESKIWKPPKEEMINRSWLNVT
jgi:hypothetical protein